MENEINGEIYIHIKISYKAITIEKNNKVEK